MCLPMGRKEGRKEKKGRHGTFPPCLISSSTLSLSSQQNTQKHPGGTSTMLYCWERCDVGIPNLLSLGASFSLPCPVPTTTYHRHFLTCFRLPGNYSVTCCCSSLLKHGALHAVPAGMEAMHTHALQAIKHAWGAGGTCMHTVAFPSLGVCSCHLR